MRHSKTIFAIILLVCAFSPYVYASGLEGHWEGKISLPGVELGIIVDLDQADNSSWTGTIDIPMQAATDLPLINFKTDASSAEFEIQGPQGKPTLKGKLSADQNNFSGDFTQAGKTYPFSLTRTEIKEQTKTQKTESEILDDIRTHVKKVMEDWHVPGLGLAIIKDGKVILAEGFGVRDMKEKKPVTADTLFAIGSSTKAFTATLMGIAVDEGKLKWDEPVKTYLLDFDLEDEFASERMTPEDLLTHRSGLPRHDLMWYGSTLTRKELFNRLHYLEPTEDFRTAFQYQNLMFMTAGYLQEQVYGKPWELLIKEKILDPLGMKNSNFSVIEMQKAPDFSRPYEYKDKESKLKEMAFRNIDAIGPAGSINSSAREMAKWVLMNLQKGSYENRQVISSSALEAIHSPEIVVRGGLFSQLLKFPEMPYLMYGMGWFIQPYRGHTMIHHGGNIDGFSALISFMPDDKLGLVLLTNLNGNLLVNSLPLAIYDRMLGLEPVDWNGRYKLKWEQFKNVGDESFDKETEVLRKSGTKPSHGINQYAGEYEHPAYGQISISAASTKLRASIHGISSALEHFHYDVFRATEDEAKGLKLTFLTNLRGDIDRVSLPLEDGVDEIIFARIPDASMNDPKFLDQFAGLYELMGLEVKVERKEKNLMLTVPGQPTYTLVPYRGTEFDVKDQEGYSVKFTLAKGAVTEVIFVQPNGVFTAKRK